ncbi:MAG TPA: UDP-3-O-(3-hydroxymyristoyl)glucosamine N-acyltransferase [Candidatus Hydrothermia bacterium]|nr:UDP-3-O-(3-hydroxymyristoyl)glucosamine N-acyltransferase [Candidatus Hydrothermae bacterium]MDD3648521.1 UDP-3-O-(3-hydroxymyristoyl)glucosamine N-acyltransferase [Candidatus Hydrothermia bacterium]MDD5572479.1 UDP-3-O-(3-hydroxymyristoyl)glucosamine N-acyltransferase [Candidatus Hydrothermia bacterium]HOP32851.1 UDP-3-O-(3-hydroxymyristoyl)glucosamine N-acyltransferase [Candidatus Hydrothermia bacterium]HRD22645.1 UDP-3-O-(3-hydroxymyristoyl)glucosamine N-acyltransferase [Candidatus Hydrot
MKSSDIAKLLNATLEGDPDFPIKKPVPIKEAGEDDCTFLFDEKYDADKTYGVLLASFRPRRARAKALILTDKKEEAMIAVLSLFKKVDRFSTTEPVAKGSVIASNVKIPPFVFIGEKSTIGSNSQIYPFVFIASDVEIGCDVTIHPFVYIGHDVKIGDHTIIFSGTVIGADGFGFHRTSEGYIKIPQIGGVIIEENCEIGANVTIDRATMGNTIIKKGTKLDDQVHVGHNVEIGENTVIAGQTGIAGSTKVGSWVMMGGQVGIGDHLEISDKTIILAKSAVTKSLLRPGIYGGYFARERLKMLKIMALEERLPELWERLKKLEEKIEGKDS